MDLVSSFHAQVLPEHLMSSTSGIAMGKYGSKRAIDGVIDSHGWRKFLKDLHPTKTSQEVAARTGISADTVEKWFRGASPSFPAALVLIDVYGPEFGSICLPGCRWMAAAAREARRARLDEIITSAATERERLMERR